MTGRLQDALAAKRHVWGGWVVGPTILGPEEFARAGYDYVGFDLQHGYLCLLYTSPLSLIHI